MTTFDAHLTRRAALDLAERVLAGGDIDAAPGDACHLTLHALGVTRTDLVLHGDPELLSQALINLLRNGADAVAATEAPIIHLSAVVNGSGIAFSVCDNGPGVPADRLQEIFVPFFTTKSAGSGIGLTLARQIALAHGGRMEAINQPGGGVLFRMTLPIKM